MLCIVQAFGKCCYQMINGSVEDDESMPEMRGLDCWILICICNLRYLQRLFRFVIRFCAKCFIFVYR